MPADPIYLYSAGQRRHIADPEGGQHMGGRYRAPLCDSVHYATDEQMSAELRRWTTVERAEKAAARKRSLPVCKRCERKAADAL